MSVHVTSWVLRYSEERLGNRLVLLALADYAHDDGSKAYPTNETLQRDARLGERQVRNCLRSLEANGSIEQTKTLPDGRKVYRIVMENAGGQNLPGQNPTEKVSDIAPDPPDPPEASPSSTGWLPQSVGGRPVTDQEREWTDTLMDVFNAATGKRFGGKEWRAMVVRRLREHLDVGLDELTELVKHQCAHPWWDGDPTPSVIFGNGKVFDRALNRVEGKRDDKPRTNYDRD